MATEREQTDVSHEQGMAVRSDGRKNPTRTLTVQTIMSVEELFLLPFLRSNNGQLIN